MGNDSRRNSDSGEGFAVGAQVVVGLDGNGRAITKAIEDMGPGDLVLSHAPKVPPAPSETVGGR